ncbi:MAG: bifunctional UDP-N-acetylglucosamine diphosphorylase/glucosamine-1-phosphate N-acetyltransferase GlmU [Paracoccaceae bacterium]
MSTALIILAAGQGTRMNSDLPKVLHKLGGAPLFAHALAAGRTLEAEKTVLVVGYGGAEVARAAHAIDPDIVIVEQGEPLGTGHAVAQAQGALRDFDGEVVVLYGDTPFIRPQTLRAMADARANFDLVVLGFEAADPGRYGRLIMNGPHLKRIVEFSDADAGQKKITFCNSGIKMASARVMFDLIGRVERENADGEYYLTDIVEIANQRGLSATAVSCDEAETLGINSRQELAAAEAVFQRRARADALENGVALTSPDTVFFALDTVLGRDVVVEPNVVFGVGVTVESGALIRAFSHLEGCHVGSGAIVGPYARLRPGADLSKDARVGNFVEIKNSEIGEGSKVNHLAYVGDTTIGAHSNIGAGTVTCNYDGVSKHRTVIGNRAFIRSDTMLIAPVKIGDEAMTASGSVITKDVPDGALALGRAAQKNFPGGARKLFEKYKAAKARRDES